MRELAGAEHPAVAGDDRAVLADQHRVGPAPFPDRGRDLIDLRLAVGAGIARIRDKRSIGQRSTLSAGHFPADVPVAREFFGSDLSCIVRSIRPLPADDHPLNPGDLVPFLESSRLLREAQEHGNGASITLQRTDDDAPRTASAFEIFLISAPSRRETSSFRILLKIVLKFWLPFGRPLGLPDCPG